MSNANLNSQCYRLLSVTINGKSITSNIELTPGDIKATPLNGSLPMSGNLTIMKPLGSALVLHNTENSDKTTNRKYIELSDDGALNIITRDNEGSSGNKGIYSFPPGVKGNVVTDLGFTMKGIISHENNTSQFRGFQGSLGPNLNSLASNESGRWGYAANLSRSSANLFPTDNNANGALTFSMHDGYYNLQIGFNSRGDIYKRVCQSGTWTGWVTLRSSDVRIAASEVDYTDMRSRSVSSLNEIIEMQNKLIKDLTKRVSALESANNN